MLVTAPVSTRKWWGPPLLHQPGLHQRPEHLWGGVHVGQLSSLVQEAFRWAEWHSHVCEVWGQEDVTTPRGKAGLAPRSRASLPGATASLGSQPKRQAGAFDSATLCGFSMPFLLSLSRPLSPPQLCTEKGPQPPSFPSRVQKYIRCCFKGPLDQSPNISKEKRSFAFLGTRTHPPLHVSLPWEASLEGRGTLTT